ncbi:LLM class flavin-dependent oxidoreductase [Streptomyces sp. M19]
MPAHAQRYARAAEFLDVVLGLWGSWEPGATVGDKTRNVYVDPDQVHELNHRGPHFAVRGPSTLPRSRQGRPVVFQAGSSEHGRELAARYADAVFTAQNTLQGAIDFRADIRRRAAAHGRSPKPSKSCPACCPYSAAPRARPAPARTPRRTARPRTGTGEARPQGRPARGGTGPRRALPIARIRENAEFRGSHGFRDAAVALAEHGRLTVRELLYANGGGHLQVVGTPRNWPTPPPRGSRPERRTASTS